MARTIQNVIDLLLAEVPGVPLGRNKALVIVGHAKSEEEGMHYLAQWLQPQVPAVPITYVAVGDPVSVV